MLRTVERRGLSDHPDWAFGLADESPIVVTWFATSPDWGLRRKLGPGESRPAVRRLLTMAIPAEFFRWWIVDERTGHPLRVPFLSESADSSPS